MLAFVLVLFSVAPARAEIPYRGTQSRGAILYPGIVYAEVPARWKRARAIPSPRQMDRPIACPQVLADSLPNDELPQPMSEDCLALNVWAPKTPGPHPVLFFVHGGALLSGSGLKQFYDGSVFARRGIVFVAINYRLGELGFGPKLESRPGSLGLLDQGLALAWTVKNIAQFGGDPANITLMGQSKGAEAVGALLETGLADGHVKGAIALSGPKHFEIEGNLFLPAGQSEFYPGEKTESYPKILAKKGRHFYQPEVPFIRHSGEGSGRFKVLVSSIEGEFDGHLFCLNMHFPRETFDYVDTYVYVLHPGPQEHGSELQAIFAEDAYGRRLLDLFTRFASTGQPPAPWPNSEPRPFRDHPVAYHVYPYLTLEEDLTAIRTDPNACETFRGPFLRWRWGMVNRVMGWLGGFSSVNNKVVAP